MGRRHIATSVFDCQGLSQGGVILFEIWIQVDRPVKVLANKKFLEIANMFLVTVLTTE